MRFPPLTPAVLERRYQRFLADCRLGTGDRVTAHCPNSGSMLTCSTPGQSVLLSHDPRPHRKLAYTWELYDSGASWVCINTQRPNAVAAEAIGLGTVPELAGYATLRREVPYQGRHRVDILLEDPERTPCYVEVKSCTLLGDDGVIRFPDAVTERGRRHLDALMAEIGKGSRAVMLFLIGREEGRGFAPADGIDPAYGKALRRARDGGVEILAYRSHITPDSMVLMRAEAIFF